MKKICILGASLSTNNMGVGVLMAGIVKSALHALPEAELTLMDYAHRPGVNTLELPGGAVSLPLVNMRFSWKLWLPNNIARLLLLAALMRLLPGRAWKERLVERNDCLRCMRSSTVVVSIAGGDSFSDIYGLSRMMYVSLPQVLAILLGCRLVLLPQTLGPFKGRVAQRLAAFIVARAERVYSRDHRPPSGLQCAPEKITFCYDVGFVVDAIAPPVIKIVGLPLLGAGHRRIGVNLSGLLWMGGYSRKNMFGLRVQYDQVMLHLLRRLLADPANEVLLVSHVFGEGGESDQVVSRQAYAELSAEFPGRIGMVEGIYNQNQVKYIIGGCDFFIGSRMHACIAALSQRIPSVAIAYSDKFIGVFQAVGVAGLVVDPREVANEEQLIAAVLQRLNEAAQMRAELVARMPEIQATVLRLFADFVKSAPMAGGKIEFDHVAS